jgi:hypothetical protein
MSVRKNAPYQDQWHDTGEHAGMLEYEGHDAPRGSVPGGHKDPKKIDQPLALPSGKPTDNGKFFAAAKAAATGEAEPEIVQVYEKIADGIWCDRGRHELVDAEIKTVPISPRSTKTGSTKTRSVCRFYLRPAATPTATTRDDEMELAINRQIPPPQPPSKSPSGNATAASASPAARPTTSTSITTSRSAQAARRSPKPTLNSSARDTTSASPTRSSPSGRCSGRWSLERSRRCTAEREPRPWRWL